MNTSNYVLLLAITSVNLKIQIIGPNLYWSITKLIMTIIHICSTMNSFYLFKDCYLTWNEHYLIQPRQDMCMCLLKGAGSFKHSDGNNAYPKYQLLICFRQLIYFHYFNLSSIVFLEVIKHSKMIPRTHKGIVLI